MCLSHILWIIHLNTVLCGGASWFKIAWRLKGASLVAQLVKNPPAMQETWVWYLGGEDSLGGGHGNPLQYSCLKNPYGWRSLVGYSPWCRKESDTSKLVMIHRNVDALKQLLHNFLWVSEVPPKAFAAPCSPALETCISLLFNNFFGVHSSFFFKFYLFIFGYVGSSLLGVGFL